MNAKRKVMSDKEKLIKFVLLKNEIIEKETGIKYVEQEDIDDIQKWKEGECEEIYYELIQTISNDKTYGVGESTCIWCLKNNPLVCFDCEYGKKHGICFQAGSLYDSYRTDEVMKMFTNEIYKNIIQKIEDESCISI